MKYLVPIICAVMFWSGAAAAQEMPAGSNAAPNFLLIPSLTEVIDVIKQGQEKKKDPDGGAAPAFKPRKGSLRPYLGVDETSLNAYLVPGNHLDVTGGLSYYLPRAGKTGTIGVVFAVKDRVSNRLDGYVLDPSNLTTYFTLSINY